MVLGINLAIKKPGTKGLEKWLILIFYTHIFSPPNVIIVQPSFTHLHILSRLDLRKCYRHNPQSLGIFLVCFFVIFSLFISHSAQFCLQVVSQQFIFSQRLHFWAQECQWLSDLNFSQLLFWDSSVTSSKTNVEVEHGAFILVVSWGEENALISKA